MQTAVNAMVVGAATVANVLLKLIRDTWGIRVSGVNNRKFEIDSDRLKFGRRIHTFVKWSLRMYLLGYQRDVHYVMLYYVVRFMTSSNQLVWSITRTVY